MNTPAETHPTTLRTLNGEVFWSGPASSVADALRQASRERALLHHLDLRGQDLRGIDLRRTDLSGSDFSHSDLSGSDLTRAELAETRLIGTNLQGARLTAADLTEADLTGADLTGADLQDTDFENATLSRAKLSGTDLKNASLSGAKLNGTDVTATAAGRIPVVQGLHRKVADAVQDTALLDMDRWHCGSAHCRAGWVVTLAGKEGRALEEKLGTGAAAALIYAVSETATFETETIPDFFAGNDEALADIRRLGQVRA